MKKSTFTNMTTAAAILSYYLGGSVLPTFFFVADNHPQMDEKLKAEAGFISRQEYNEILVYGQKHKKALEDVFNLSAKSPDYCEKIEELKYVHGVGPVETALELMRNGFNPALVAVSF